MDSPQGIEGEGLIPARTAHRLLAAAGVTGLNKSHDLVWAGLAGEAVGVGRRWMYRRSAVEDLCARPVVTPDDVSGVAASGVLVARMRARGDAPPGDPRKWIGFDAFAPVAEQEAAFAGWWRPPRGGYRRLVERLEAGPLPLVVAVSGVVAAVRDVQAVSPLIEGRVEFDVAAAGPWAGAFCRWDDDSGAPVEPFAGFRLATGGGGPLIWWP